MKVALAHPTGNRNVRAVLAALHEAGALSAFHSALAISREATWPRLLPNGLRREFERRRYELPRAMVHAHPVREIVRLAAARFGVRRLVAHESGWACVDRVYAAFDRKVARCITRGERPQAVYAYEDGADVTFAIAAEAGIRRVYDLPIAYWETLRDLLTEEAARLPEWAVTLGGGLGDSVRKRERKTRELRMAELVVTPSRFVADSLPAWCEGKRVLLTPFGSPPVLAEAVASEAERLRARRAAEGRPLRVMFAGSMGQRKGLGDLMAAVTALGRNDVELVVMGSLQAEPAFYQSQCQGFRHEGGRPHAQVLELMRSCDVFCLPSIVEGRALVLQEAMSQGLPLIITPNTGGDDLVGGELTLSDSILLRSGQAARTHRFGRCPTGFLVPIRSPERIAEAIAWCADNRPETIAMGRAARARAAEYTWSDYGRRVVAAIRDLTRHPVGE